MRTFEGMTVVTGVCRREVVTQPFTVLVRLTFGMNTLEQQGVEPGPAVEVKVLTDAFEVIMQDRCIVSVAVVREHVTSLGESDKVIIDAAKRDAVFQQEFFGYMVHRFRFGRDSELPFGEDVPVTLVDDGPGVGVELNKGELDDMLFLHI